MMRRALALISLLGCACFEFWLYPGHTILSGGSQTFVPMLERLQHPGLLSRDLVATHPILRYTIYDEATLFIEQASRLGLEHALAIQQFCSRFAFLGGVYLLVFRLGVGRIAAVSVAAFCALGLYLPGVDVQTVERDPVPYALAVGYLILSAGFWTGEKVLLSGVSAGVALLYSPALALPFWVALLICSLSSRQYRSALKPLLTIFFIFLLLIANLSQLQPGAPGGTASGVPEADSKWLQIIAARVPAAAPLLWVYREGWLYAAMAIATFAAIFRLSKIKSNRATAMLTSLSITGCAGLALGCLAMKALPITIWAQIDLARSLLLLGTSAFVACATTGCMSLQRRRWSETAMWWIACGVLAGVPLVRAPQAASRPEPRFRDKSIRQLAVWAESSTWGASLFQFAGEGRANDSGRFRALSLRPVYVEWEGGDLVRYFRDFAEEWWARWERVSQQLGVQNEIAALLTEPIDYYVVAERDRLPDDVKPVYSNSELLVYDARDLRQVRRRSKRLD